MQQMEAQENWSSRFVFLMAAVGAAVGLGNLWKFPYTAGVSGGAAFVIVYIVAIIFVATPIVMAELLIGRRGKMSPINSIRNLAKAEGAARLWGWIGGINVLAVFVIMSFYSVIAGWAIAYIPKAATGVLQGLSGAEADALFDDLLASPGQMAFFHGVFIGLTIFIVGQGVQKGIERAVKFLMPSLFVLLLVLVGYAAVKGDFAGAVAFLFQADFSKIDANVLLSAIGQAFFSVSVAMGLLISYGSYLNKEINITRAAIIIAGADTLVALLAGLVIFPLVFANGLDAAEGPGLLFVTLPIAFGNMPAGALFGTVFFALILVSAVTSSIAGFEPIVAWADEHRGMKRGLSALIIGIAAWLVGLLTVFSFNLWGDFYPLDAFESFKGKSMFDLLAYFTNDLMLPLGGALLAIFAGWVMSRDNTREELGLPDGPVYAIWLLLVRYLCPVAVGAVFLAYLFG